MHTPNGIQALEAQERKSPSSKVVHDAVMQEGMEELRRPSSALAWAGFAAGLSMGFSLIAEGLLYAYLPDASWRPLVSKLGYSLGFLIVIMGRQQLFTENTLTPILPLMQQKSFGRLLNVLRLWVIVLATNLIGAAVIGYALANTNGFESEVRRAFIEIGQETLKPAIWTVMLRGVFAGWLIALIVWLIPFAEAARIYIIILLSYFIGLGKMSHVIAGSVEVYALASINEISWGKAVLEFTVPALIGNVIGGVSLVAALNHAQVVAGETASQSNPRTQPAAS